MNPVMSTVKFPLAGRRVYVAGHRGMAGSAICRRLEREGCTLLTATRAELDLRRQAETEAWMKANRPEAVFVASATVGGIIANSTRPAEFLYDNLAIEANIIHAAREVGVAKLLFLGASCMYPREAAQPVAEDALLTGLVEPTNEWYALAKIAGLKLCQAYRRQYGCDFITVVPNNLFGLNDRFDPTHGHVVAAMIMKFHTAKTEGRDAVELWGTGSPLREFLYSEDMADACVFLMQSYSDEAPVNVGSGIEITIRQLAETIARTVGYEGRLVFDTSKPDGIPRKLLDCTRIHDLGWTSSTSLEAGMAEAYRWYLDNAA
jgi:GDP-L-fucose synthase